MRHVHFLRFLFCAILVTFFAETPWAAESDPLQVHPEILDMGTFYSGGQITISGEVPGGQDVIVEVAGPTGNGQFDLKGRLGPFWMTRDRAELDGAPVMYALLLPGRRWQRKASALGLGLENLRRKISIKSATLAPAKIFNMFLDLKKSEGLYVVLDKAVSYKPAGNSGRRFKAICCLPRSMAPGKYTVRAVGVANGAKGMVQTGSFLVHEVGFARLVDDLATNKRLTYGILAVVIALFAGAVMGFLFRGGGGH